LELFKWLGMEHDAYYRQSERTEIYRSYLHKMIASGHAYVSKEIPKEEGGRTEVIRFKNPNGVVTFNDEVLGEISFNTTELGDFIIARDFDSPLYHLTVVIDDFEMGITHIIRGQEHVSNTPRQILIQEAIGATRPLYAHLPLLLGKDRSKLSKRHGATQLSSYQEQGYLPEALVNYLAFLGWNPGTDKEVFTLPELITSFDLGGVQKSGAIFDIEKLNWFNKEHLRTLPDDLFMEMVLPRLPEETKRLSQFNEERLGRLLATIRERISVAADVTKEASAGEYDFAFTAPHPDPLMIKWKNDQTPRETLPRLQKLAEILSTIPEGVTSESVKEYIWDYATEVGKGEVLWPLRVALTGKERSPDPFTVIAIIGSGEAYKRVKTACDTILST